MTIIIKDMDMPECCTKCPIAKYEYDFDTFECPLTSRLEYMSDDDSWNQMSNGRFEDCPLEEVDDYE